MSWRVAIASLDGVSVSEHFGRADYFYIIDVQPDGSGILFEKRKVQPLCTGGEHSESGLESSAAALSDCLAILVAKIGPHAQRFLESKGISVFEKADYIDDAVKKLAVYYHRLKQPVNKKQIETD